MPGAMASRSRAGPVIVPPAPELTLIGGWSHPTRAYDIAGCVVHTDVEEPWLRPFRSPGAPSGSGSQGRRRPSQTLGSPVYDGPGLVGGVVRRVVRHRTETGFILEVEGVGSTAVDLDSGLAYRLSDAGVRPSAVDAEVLFGPVLVILLATRGIFCLHASAARLDRRAVAFLGPSGAGKSTLARDAPRASGWERVGDDILPVALSGSGADALPRFPQIKLPEEAQWGRRRPERVRIRSAYSVRTRPPEHGREVLVSPADARDAMLHLVSFTIASRLFDRALTERHLAFCDALTRRVRVRELSYPRSLEALPAVFDALERDHRSRV